MSNFSLLILCAGLGKRMLNLTKDIPKPLLEGNNITLLGNTINFFSNIGCKEIFINTHYLHHKIITYINERFNDYPINIIYEPSILGTGGGIKNIFNYTKSKNICVVNSDIFWQTSNKSDILTFLEDFNEITHCKILLSKKNNFIGLKKDQGDFNIEKGIISNWVKGNETIYYTGFQIVSKNIFVKSKEFFPMNEIWENLILNKNLKGDLIHSNIIHIGDKNTFEEF